MSEDLRISVVLPLYNGERFVRGAIQSVLAQTLQPDQIVVVDDGSSDNGRRCVEPFADADARISVIRQANRGQSAARNAGIAMSRGRLIALIDQDDLWAPDHLAELVRPFQRAGGRPLGWTYSNVVAIDADGRQITPARFQRRARRTKSTLLDCLTDDMMILPSATLLSRAAFNAAGGFDETLRGYEDDDLLVRILSLGFRNECIPAPLTKWRHHANNASFSAGMAQSRLRYFHKLIDRFGSSPQDGSTRRIIVRRFVRREAIEAARALVHRNKEGARTAVQSLATMQPLMPYWSRTSLTILKPFLNALLRV